MTIDHSKRSFVKGGTAAIALSPILSLPGFSSNLFAAESKLTPVSKAINGMCSSCLYKKCFATYTVKDGVLTSISGNSDGTYNKGSLCSRGNAQIKQLYNPYRVKQPLIRTNPEKGLNVDPKWKPISWSEALSLCTDKIRKVIDKDPREFVYFTGFGSFENTLNFSFPKALGTPNIISSPGAFCSVHSASETMHGSFVQAADFNHAKFVISIGENELGQGHADGRSKLEVDALGKGCKIVRVDPRNSAVNENAEWLPIKPHSELAFLLAIEHVMLHELNKFDRQYVSQMTNATYLVDANGDYLRDAATNKPLVWDGKRNKALPFDSKHATSPTLEGRYTVNGKNAAPAFHHMLKACAETTPEWAETITTIPADKTRALAKQLVAEARIGDTIKINGTELPHRPACLVMGRGLSNHRNGATTYAVMHTINVLLGAFDVPGGNIGLNNLGYKMGKDGHPAVFHLAPKDGFKVPSNRLDLDEYFMNGHDTGYQFVNAVNNKAFLGLDYTPRVAISTGCNLFSKGGSEREIERALTSFEFMVGICHHMEEHSQFCDILLPESNSMEFDFVSSRQFTRAANLDIQAKFITARPKLIEPLYNSRPADEILLELATRLGKKPKMVKLTSIIRKLPFVNHKSINSVADIYDLEIRSVKGEGVSFSDIAEQQHCNRTDRVEDHYPYLKARANGIKIPVYNIAFKEMGDQISREFANSKFDYPFGEDALKNIYNATPTWFYDDDFAHSGNEFNLNLIGWRNSMFMHDVSNVTGNPLLHEVARHDPMFGKLVINPKTMKKMGLNEQDSVFVENKLGVKEGPVPLYPSELIHPEAVGVVAGHRRSALGMNKIQNSGLSWNRLTRIDWKAVDPVTGAIEITPAVKLTRA